jgi:thiamine-phosphate pyrophosphorylase
MTDTERLADPIAAVRGLPAGSAVILRHYDAPGRADLARRLRRLTRAGRIRLLIAGDARLARAVKADGLHLAEPMVRHGNRRWRLWRRPGWLVTAAAHSEAAIVAAKRAGCDAALVSPVFATPSHPGMRPLGVFGLARLVRRAGGMKAYALGGMNTATARRLRPWPLAGMAGISALAQ